MIVIVGYIYLTTNTETGLIYVGQKRSSMFLGNKYLGSGKMLKEAVKEYGRDAFEVTLLEEIEDEDLLEEREVYWITYYNATDRSVGYNLCKNGHVCRLVGKDNPFYGKKHTAESLAKMSEASKHRERFPMAEETKRKISEKLKGREITWSHKLSENAKTNPNYGMKGKSLSESAKQKLSVALQEAWSDEKKRKQFSETTKSRWQDPEYRRKHVEGMRNGKKRVIRQGECPVCHRMISLSNLSRHVATHDSNKNES